MNTIDIRNSNSGQWLYWSVALPVTVLVFGLSYLYAYKWEALSSGISKGWLSVAPDQKLQPTAADEDYNSSWFSRLRRLKRRSNTERGYDIHDTWDFKRADKYLPGSFTTEETEEIRRSIRRAKRTRRSRR